MAVDIQLDETLVRYDPQPHASLERALRMWHEARACFEAVDPSALSADARAAYYRSLVRIGLWADAKVCGEPSDAESDAGDPDTSD